MARTKVAPAKVTKAKAKVAKPDELDPQLVDAVSDAVIARIAALLGGQPAATELADDEETEDEEEGDEEEADEGDEEETEEEEEETEEEETEEGEEEEETEESEEEEGVLEQIQAELDSIPASLFEQAATDSKGTPPAEMKKELVAYLTLRGVDDAEAAATVKALSSADLKSVFNEYFARFIDTDGEVHETDEPYKALRIVDGEEEEVDCCNGVPMVDGVCAVNPEITLPKPKKKAAPAAKGKAAPAKGKAAPAAKGKVATKGKR